MTTQTKCKWNDRKDVCVKKDETECHIVDKRSFPAQPYGNKRRRKYGQEFAVVYFESTWDVEEDNPQDIQWVATPHKAKQKCERG